MAVVARQRESNGGNVKNMSRLIEYTFAVFSIDLRGPRDLRTRLIPTTHLCFQAELAALQWTDKCKEIKDRGLSLTNTQIAMWMFKYRSAAVRSFTQIITQMS